MNFLARTSKGLRYNPECFQPMDLGFQVGDYYRIERGKHLINQLEILVLQLSLGVAELTGRVERK